ncbi:hypothetical protein WA026_022479 [Henosepilachna vigintioctopunctata]|uniref:Apolipoprotein D n=1 Tax=Henosepilachna vigintioctopunctata TaxID=420089 RepID=A0AAW1TPI6_9CUCU
MFKYLALFVVLAHGIQAQKIIIGLCPRVNVQENFDLEKYLGTWYEAEKYSEPFELGGKCMKQVWSGESNGKISVLEQLIKKNSGKVVNGDNTAKFVGNRNEAKLTLDTPGVPFGAPYWILETDYDNYSVVWSCIDTGLLNIRFTWILTRDRHPSESIMKKAYAVYDRYNLIKTFEKTDQDDCPSEF